MISHFRIVNKMILFGNLAKTRTPRFTSSGKAVTRFSLATSNTWIDANGETRQATEWHTVVVWGKQGEACSQYLEKGHQVYVEGTLRHRSNDNKDGKGAALH
jgi:single-strand DNA-binding protein